MIEREDRGAVTVLRMARGKGNAYNAEFCAAIDRALDDVERSDAKAIVLTGQGTVFSAGVDLFSVVEGGNDYLAEFLPIAGQLFRRIFVYPKPIVAAVNGHAIAGGCVVTQAADYRIFTDGNAKMGLTELQVGVPFPTSALEIVRFAVPRRYLQEIILLARTYSPAEALERGLVDEVVSADSVLDRACALAEQLARILPETFRLTKEQLRGEAVAAIERDEPVYDPRVIELWTAPEVHAVIRAYIEKTVKQKR